MSCECPICYEEIKTSVTSNCGHQFCYSCFSKFIENSPDCPMCREKLFSEDDLNTINSNKLESVENYLCEHDSIIRERAVEYLCWLFENRNSSVNSELRDFKKKILTRLDLHQNETTNQVTVNINQRPTTGGLRLPTQTNNLIPTRLGLIDFTGYTGPMRVNGRPDKRHREYDIWIRNAWVRNQSENAN